MKVFEEQKQETVLFAEAGNVKMRVRKEKWPPQKTSVGGFYETTSDARDSLN